MRLRGSSLRQAILVVVQVLLSTWTGSSLVSAGTGNLVLVVHGTVITVEPVDDRRELWRVTMEVDRVISGHLSEPTFTFTVHSPAKAGFERRTATTVKAVWVDGAYVVDPLLPAPAPESPLSDIDVADGIDANEAHDIAGEYFDHHFGLCGALRSPTKTRRTWVFGLVSGAVATPLKDSITVDSKTGGVWSTDGPRYATLESFRKAISARRAQKAARPKP